MHYSVQFHRQNVAANRNRIRTAYSNSGSW